MKRYARAVAIIIILLVEDEPYFREVIADSLEVSGASFRLEIASNFDDGIVLLHASPPALLIADVLLPGSGDGLRLAQLARDIAVPTLLISGRPEVIAQQEAQGLPFLSKPFRLPELLRAIRPLVAAGLGYRTEFGIAHPAFGALERERNGRHG